MFIVSLGRLLVVQPAYSKDATRAFISWFRCGNGGETDRLFPLLPIPFSVKLVSQRTLVEICTIGTSIQTSDLEDS